MCIKSKNQPRISRISRKIGAETHEAVPWIPHAPRESSCKIRVIRGIRGCFWGCLNSYDITCQPSLGIDQPAFRCFDAVHVLARTRPGCAVTIIVEQRGFSRLGTRGFCGVPSNIGRSNTIGMGSNFSLPCDGACAVAAGARKMPATIFPYAPR
jgi:hypothetical protein